MRFVVVGAGGIGGWLGARLAAAGHEVALVARGAHLAALRADGLHLHSPAGDVVVRPVQASDDAAALGPADVVLLAVKTWQLPALLPALGPLIGPGTAVLTTQNGVEAPHQVARAYGRDAVLPGTAKIFAEIEAPGRIRHVGGPGLLTYGEWDDRRTDRVERLREALTGAGVAALVPDDIWAELWTKFLFVVPLGGLSAATGATTGVLRSRPGTRALLAELMGEIQAVAAAHGVVLPADVVAATLAFLDQQPAAGRTSLHRDIHSGRPSELDAWTGAVVRLAAATGTPAPRHAMLYELLAARLGQDAADRAVAGAPEDRGPAAAHN
ncbi:2-dehydropantoate 2-reductase [Micromonospora sp. NPDC050686]|uniref:2-dehydropantoate 2-reductase n=1 Tax=Micromonospora sp. NPDC050686 TaxID=3154631 RepID=UPI0033C8825D